MHERLREELQRYLAISAYLFAAFCALLFLRSVLMGRSEGVLTIVEEMIVGRFHGRSVAEVMGEFGARSAEITARCIVMLMLLLPLVTMTEMDRVLGRGTLLRLLKGPAQPGK